MHEAHGDDVDNVASAEAKNGMTGVITGDEHWDLGDTPSQENANVRASVGVDLRRFCFGVVCCVFKSPINLAPFSA